jgi:hypothetical protein
MKSGIAAFLLAILVGLNSALPAANSAVAASQVSNPISPGAAIRFKRIEPVLKDFDYQLTSALCEMFAESLFICVRWENPADDNDGQLHIFSCAVPLAPDLFPRVILNGNHFAVRSAGVSPTSKKETM